MITERRCKVISIPNKIKLTIVALSALALVGCGADVENYPTYTQQLIENDTEIIKVKEKGVKFEIYNPGAYADLTEDGLLQLVSGMSDIGYTEFTFNTFTNPTSVSETYTHPYIRETAGIAFPRDLGLTLLDTCQTPLVLTTDVTFADGSVQSVELFTYVMDYSVIYEQLPQVVLPYQVYSIPISEQERLVIECTYRSDKGELVPSDLINIPYYSGDINAVFQLGLSLEEYNQALSGDAVLLFRHLMPKW